MIQSIPYTPPSFQAEGFNCPFCKAFAEQYWGTPTKIVNIRIGNKNINLGADEDYVICYCSRCKKISVWVEKKMVFPRAVTSPPPNIDIPDGIKIDYKEAQLILSDSPRGAAALLRLAIQKLCAHLGESGKNINSDIASLVKKGLPLQIQQALDIVRVVGNNAVHPGQLDIQDNIETANKLFGLINLIADVMITQPKHVEDMYNTIVPENQRKAIEKRNHS